MMTNAELVEQNSTMVKSLIECAVTIREMELELKSRRPDGHVHFMEVWMSEMNEGQFLFSFPRKWEELPDEAKIFALDILMTHFTEYRNMLNGDESVRIEKGSLEDFNDRQVDH